MRIRQPRFAYSPPILPESRSSILCSQTQLPPRQDWVQLTERYFEEINSTYWLISSESFYSRLDTAYAAQDAKDFSASWMCFLYTVLALTTQMISDSGTSRDGPRNELGLATPSSRCTSNIFTSNDYISVAKSLVQDVLDEANLDSVRALCAMVSDEWNAFIIMWHVGLFRFF